MMKSILEGQKNILDMMIAHNEIMMEREEKAKNTKLMQELIVQLDGKKVAESVVKEIRTLREEI